MRRTRSPTATAPPPGRPCPANGAAQFLTLGYATPVHASAVTVRETLGNGFVTQIDVLDTNNVLHTVWTGTDPSLPGTPVDFLVTFPTTPYLVKGVKVYVNINHSVGWEEIDAVALHGSDLADVTVVAEDGRGGFDTQSFTLEVDPVRRAARSRASSTTTSTTTASATPSTCRRRRPRRSC